MQWRRIYDLRCTKTPTVRKIKLSGCSRYIWNVYRGPVTDMKLPWIEDYQWCTSTAEVKNDCSYTSTPSVAFMTWTGTTLPLRYAYIELLYVLTRVINTGCRNGYMYFYCINLCHCLFLNISQLDALNFIISLFQASTCFEHMCSSSGRQTLCYIVSGIITPIGVMIPETI